MSNIPKNQKSLFVAIKNKFVKCQNFKQASEIVRKYIDKSEQNINEFGSNMFYKHKNAGHIYHPTKGVIAHVSYNGRVWSGKDSFNCSEITNLLLNNI